MDLVCTVRECVEVVRECTGALIEGTAVVLDVPSLPCDDADASVEYGTIVTT